jgi:hypothetical protein
MTAIRKTLTISEYLDALLDQRMLIDKSLKEHVKEKTNFSGDEELLNLEAKIFSLWLISLTIDERELKDMFHKRYCNTLGLDRIQIPMFYQQIKIRYDNYNYAFNCWAKDPRSGYILGGVMTEIIVNQNPNFSTQGKLPMTDCDIDMGMNVFFSLWFKSTLDFLIKLKENFILPVLN